MDSDPDYPDTNGADAERTDDAADTRVSRRDVLRGTAATASALGLGLGVGAGTAGVAGASEHRQSFRVRIENVSTRETLSTPDGSVAVPLSPGVFAVHNGNASLFDALDSASDGLEALAEDGMPGGLASEVAGTDGVTSSGTFAGDETVTDPNQPGNGPQPPIFPGGAYEFTVSAAPGEAVSFATMMIQSNDLFYAPDVSGIELFEDDDPVSGDVTDQVGLWDAGTEVDQRPGTGPDQAPRQSSLDTGADQNGDVAPLSLTEAGGYDYPAVEDVVRVTVTPLEPRPVEVTVENVASTETFPADTPTDGGVWLTPGGAAVHSGSNPVYTEGESASPGLELLAEAGPPSDLVPELGDTDRVEQARAYTPAETVADPNDPMGSVPGAPPIAPGGAFQFEVDAAPGARLSLASMIVPSNDAFVSTGSNGIELFEDGNRIVGDVSRELRLLDAGTEPNGEPGVGPDQAPAQDSPDQGADEGGVVRPLDEAENTASYPDVTDAVRVTVSPPADTLPTETFRVRVENVAPTDYYPSDTPTGGAIWITPGAFAVHPGMNPIFVPGREASPGLELLAEAGPPSDLVPELRGNPRVESAGAYTPAETVADPNDPMGSVPGAPPIAPGGAFEFEVDASPGHRLSIASMFVPSNDVLFAPGSSGIELFEDDDPVSGDVTDALDLWDAGTEPNGQPGVGPDQAPAQDSPDQGADEGGVVRRLSTVGDGFDYPAVEEAIAVSLTPQ